MTILQTAVAEMQKALLPSTVQESAIKTIRLIDRLARLIIHLHLDFLVQQIVQLVSSIQEIPQETRHLFRSCISAIKPETFKMRLCQELS